MPPYDPPDRLRLRLLEAAILLCAIAWSFHLTSFLHAKEAVLALLLPAMAALVLLKKTPLRDAFRAWAPLWFGLCVTACVGLLAAQVTSRVVEETLRIAVLLLIATLSYDLLRTPAFQERIQNTVIYSAAAVAALGLLQYAGLAPGLFPKFPWYDQRIYSVFGNQDLLGGYLAMALPLALQQAMAKERLPRRHIAILPILMTGLVLSASRSAWLAACVGCVAVVPWKVPQRRRIAWIAPFLLVSVVIAVGVSDTPLYQRITGAFGSSDVGGRARLWFWDGTVRMIRDAHWTGVGLGNYGYWSPRYLGESLRASNLSSAFHNELHTLDAHCEPLHYLAETGFLGIAFIVSMAARLRGRRHAAWGGLAAAITFACFNAGLHSAPHALAALLLVSMLLPAPRTRETKPSRILPVAVLAGSCLAAAAVFWTTLLPSYLLRRAEDAHCAGQNPLALYERALAHRWPSYDAREEYGQALFEAKRFAAARAQLQIAARGVDTGKLHLLQGMTLERLRDRESARNAYEACLYRWPGNPTATKGIARVP